MLFNSLPFLLLFLPVAFAGFLLFSRISPRLGCGWLSGMSLLFYYWWNPHYIYLLLGSIGANFSFGLFIQRLEGRERRQAAVLWLGIAFNLLLLCYYKYLFPSLHGLEHIGIHLISPTARVILPLGISFFTFTQIGYLVDCKDGVAQSHRLLDYSLFVTFFPHLIAGPILHHKEIIPQIRDPKTHRFDLRNAQTGLSIFALGLAKKTLLADPLGAVADRCFVYPAALSAIGAWHGMLCYSLQLYFDFSGYSEMAMGLALLFNIRFPANFDSPYKSMSVIEFWQRWHMTLTRYVTLYVYNPLALRVARWRQARGLPPSAKATRTAGGFSALILYPTFVTMLLAGIWHGAGLQFIVYGLLHAVYITVNHIHRLLRHGGAAARRVSSWHVKAGKVLLTYAAVMFSQIFFRASSMENAVAMIRSMLALNAIPALSNWRQEFGIVKGATPSPAHILATLPNGSLWAVFILYGVVWFAPNILQIFSNYQPALTEPKTPWHSPLRWEPDARWAIAVGLTGGIAFLAVTGTTVFIYFQF